MKSAWTHLRDSVHPEVPASHQHASGTQRRGYQQVLMSDLLIAKTRGGQCEGSRCRRCICDCEVTTRHGASL